MRRTDYYKPASARKWFQHSHLTKPLLYFTTLPPHPPHHLTTSILPPGTPLSKKDKVDVTVSQTSSIPTAPLPSYYKLVWSQRNQAKKAVEVIDWGKRRMWSGVRKKCFFFLEKGKREKWWARFLCCGISGAVGGGWWWGGHEKEERNGKEAGIAWFRKQILNASLKRIGVETMYVALMIEVGEGWT